MSGPRNSPHLPRTGSSREEDGEKTPQRAGGGRPARNWVLYVLRCRDGTLYCGITNSLARRLAQHNQGKGARYTKGRGPVVLARSWAAASKPAALRAELAFKSLSREQKERKVASRSRSDRISRLLKGREP